MAERRMFAKTIIDSDAFLDMPLSTQSLYFHLSMRADDDGFINNPKKIQRMIGASDDDMKLLIAKNFIIIFESGIIVIKHWKIHNYIRGDRKKETVYPDEMALLDIKDNGAYTLNDNHLTDICQTNGCQVEVQMDTQVRLGEDRLGKDRIGECSETHTPISYDELIKKYGKDFVDERIERAKEYYKSNFTIDKVKQWCEEDFISKKKKNKSKIAFNNFPQREYDMEELERQLLSRN